MSDKIICLNIWLGGKLFDPLVEFLREQDADILLLQEVFDGTDPALDRRFRAMQALQAELGYGYHDFDRCFTQQFDFGQVPRGNAIFSKLPIISRRSHYLGGEDGVFEDIPVNFGRFRHNLQQVTVDAGGTALNLFNFQGVWDIDGDRDSPERLQMSRNIIRATQDVSNVVLAGDTNAKPATRTITDIEQHLTNMYKDELTTSFNLRRKDLEKYPGYATAVVDMAFTSPDLRVVSHECPDVDVSDHLPLIFEIEP